MPEQSRSQKLRERAEVERRKVVELDRLLGKIEARLATVRPPPGAERRVHERLDADLLIRCRPAGRTAPLVGRIRDLSRGGVCFASSVELGIGEIIQSSISRQGGSQRDAQGEVYLEVVRCRGAAGIWEIGARFVPRPTAKFDAAERRKCRRYDVRLDGLYRLPGETNPRRAEVRDISSSGVRLVTAQRLALGTTAAIVISGRPEAGRSVAGAARISVSALIRVVRCRQVGSRFDIGAEFLAQR